MAERKPRTPSFAFYIATNDLMREHNEYKIGICGHPSGVEKRYQTYGMKIIFYVNLLSDCEPKEIETYLLDKYKKYRKSNEEGKLTEIISGVEYHDLVAKMLQCLILKTKTWRKIIFAMAGDEVASTKIKRKAAPTSTNTKEVVTHTSSSMSIKNEAAPTSTSSGEYAVSTSTNTKKVATTTGIKKETTPTGAGTGKHSVATSTKKHAVSTGTGTGKEAAPTSANTIKKTTSTSTIANTKTRNRNTKNSDNKGDWCTIM